MNHLWVNNRKVLLIISQSPDPLESPIPPLPTPLLLTCLYVNIKFYHLWHYSYEYLVILLRLLSYLRTQLVFFQKVSVFRVDFTKNLVRLLRWSALHLNFVVSVFLLSYTHPILRTVFTQNKINTPRSLLPQGPFSDLTTLRPPTTVCPIHIYILRPGIYSTFS